MSFNVLNYVIGASPNNTITNNDKNVTTKDNFLVSSCFWIVFVFFPILNLFVELNKILYQSIKSIFHAKLSKYLLMKII